MQALKANKDSLIAFGPDWINNPRGTSDGLYVGYGDSLTSNLHASQTFIAFDLTSYRSMHIKKATLSLYLTYASSEYPAQQMRIQAREVRNNWNEATLTWNTSPTIFPESLSSTDVGTQFNRWIDWDISPTVVEGWANNPERNFGLVLLSPENETPGRHIRNFASREYKSGEFAPRLTIEYEQPTATPVPTNTTAPTIRPTIPPTSAETSPLLHIEPIADTFVVSGKPDENRATFPTIWVGHGTKEYGTEHSLLQFDFPAIPAGSTIQKATLSLYLSAVVDESPMNVGLYQLYGDWQENITWNQYSPLHQDLTPVVSIPVGAEYNRWYEWDIRNLVQRWITAPGSKLGMVLKGDEGTSQHERGFWSKNCPVEVCRGRLPKLEIDYTAPIPTAESTPLPMPTATPIPAPTSIPAEAESCATIGKRSNLIQPPLLNNELCDDGDLGHFYDESYIPQNLANVRDQFSNDYLIRDRDGTIYARIETLTNLRKLFDAVIAKNDPSCIPFLNSGYRSVSAQQSAFDEFNCVWDSDLKTNVVRDTKTWCGVATPRRSQHQAGIAFDMYCATLSCNAEQTECSIALNKSKRILDVLGADALKEFGIMHPIRDDRPHYLYFL